MTNLRIESLLALALVLHLGGCGGIEGGFASPDSGEIRRQLLIGDWRIVVPESDGKAGAEMTLMSDGTCSMDIHTGSWGILVPREIDMAGKWELLDVNTIKFEWVKASTGDQVGGLIETWKIISADELSLRLRKSTLSANESGSTAWTRIK